MNEKSQEAVKKRNFTTERSYSGLQVSVASVWEEIKAKGIYQYATGPGENSC